MYSGLDSSATTSYAYMELANLSGQNLVVGSTTTLSHWIFPQSPSGATTGANLTSGTQSSCVALDLIFSDGTNLRDSGASDQYGRRVHPAQQCGHLTMDAWNQVSVALGRFVTGNTGGYRDSIDDIAIGPPGTRMNNAGIPDFSHSARGPGRQRLWSCCDRDGRRGELYLARRRCRPPARRSRCRVQRRAPRPSP